MPFGIHTNSSRAYKIPVYSRVAGKGKDTFSYLFFVNLCPRITKEAFMKKISRTIAMILFLVMVASSFTGCFTFALLSTVGGGGNLILLTIPLDIITLPGQIIYFLIIVPAQTAARNSRGKKFDSIDTFSAVIRSLPKEKLDSMMQKINSLSEADLASLTQRFYSLPDEEIDSFTETVNSFSPMEIYAMVTAFNNLSEAEIVSSAETFNSMPDETLIAALNNLQHVEFRY